jgi:hypothetical protein
MPLVGALHSSSRPAQRFRSEIARFRGWIVKLQIGHGVAVIDVSTGQLAYGNVRRPV